MLFNRLYSIIYLVGLSYYGFKNIYEFINFNFIDTPTSESPKENSKSKKSWIQINSK